MNRKIEISLWSTGLIKKINYKDIVIVENMKIFEVLIGNKLNPH